MRVKCCENSRNAKADKLQYVLRLSPIILSSKDESSNDAVGFTTVFSHLVGFCPFNLFHVIAIIFYTVFFFLSLFNTRLKRFASIAYRSKHTTQIFIPLRLLPI